MARARIIDVLNLVAAGDMTAKAAEETVNREILHASSPWIDFMVVGVALCAMLGVGWASCQRTEQARLAAQPPGCPACNCNDVWQQARKHYAAEMLRGLRLRPVQGGLEAE